MEVDFLNEFYGKAAELSKLIRSWNLINASSRIQFDRLSKKILEMLYEGQSEMKISQLIESELCVTFGLFKTEFDCDQLTKEVIAWWKG